MREREIVILRVCAQNDCEYEWGVHVTAFAHHVGLSEEQVMATRLEDSGALCWTDRERALLKVVDDLCGRKRMAEHTRAQFERYWTVQEQLEILALCGNYHTICFVANTARLAPEPFAARFPRAPSPVA